jgi:uncharacterized membrane protein
MKEFFASQLLDLACLAFSMLAFVLYHLFLRWKLRKNPIYTLYGTSKLTRTAWVVNVMEERNDILAVQTLRNSTMASTFLASTAVLLAVGVLTLSGQGAKLSETWHALNFLGSTSGDTLTLKLFVLLVNLFIAFFNFSFSIRLYHHVGFMITAPSEEGNFGASYTLVSMQLNKAAHYFHQGMHAYYFLVPLIFWLFGPLFMVAATVVMIAIIFIIEKTPKMDCDYLSAFYRKLSTVSLR